MIGQKVSNEPMKANQSKKVHFALRKLSDFFSQISKKRFAEFAHFLGIALREKNKNGVFFSPPFDFFFKSVCFQPYFLHIMKLAK